MTDKGFWLSHSHAHTLALRCFVPVKRNTRSTSKQLLRYLDTYLIEIGIKISRVYLVSIYPYVYAAMLLWLHTVQNVGSAFYIRRGIVSLCKCGDTEREGGATTIEWLVKPAHGVLKSEEQNSRWKHK